MPRFFRKLLRAFGADTGESAPHAAQHIEPVQAPPSASRPAPITVAGLSGPIKVERVDPDRAIARWREIRVQTESTGIYPVVMPTSAVERPLDEAYRDTDRAEYLVDDPASLVRSFIEKQRSERTDDFADMPDAVIPRSNDPGEEGSPEPSFTVLSEVNSSPPSEVLIAHVPARGSAEAIAELFFGGWNECPELEVHAAFLGMWDERYGAELFGLQDDILECIVSRPPTQRDETFALAEEQFWYCTDIVDQGTESIDVLAASLVNAGSWYFWWD